MKKLSVLFLCTGNSCRSQMAEGWAKTLLALSPLQGDYAVTVFSAGIEAHGINPMAVKVMAESGVDIAQQTSGILAPELLQEIDWVITLCSHADSHCPGLPESVSSRHWDLPDPAKAAALQNHQEKEVLEVFRESRDAIKSLIENFILQLEKEYLGSAVPQFTKNDVEVLERKTLYKGFFEMQEFTLRHRLFQGGWSGTFTRELFVRGLAVVALLYDPERDKVVLIEQFRVGSIEDSTSPWLLELVAGIVDPGESPEDVVRREALEEAGCEVGEIIKLYEYWVSPGANSERIAIYCAKVNSQGVGGVHGLDYENEDIRVEVVDTDWAIAAIESGRIDNAATIMALQWLQLNKTRLRPG